MFQIDEERKLNIKINRIRDEISVITWVKAKQWQEHFKVKYPEHVSENDENINQSEKKLLDENINQDERKLFNDIKELINKQGELLGLGEDGKYKSEDISKEINFLADIISLDSAGNDEKNRKSSKNSRKEIDLLVYIIGLNLLESVIKDKKKQASDETENRITVEIEKKVFNDLRKQKKAITEEKIKEVLNHLDELHKKKNDEKIKLINERDKEIRKAEKFLASEEFARFAEDPYFKISKNEERKIWIGEKDFPLTNVAAKEKQVIKNGHEFSVFRGHLKEKWLNSVTYKVESEKASYFIRLSRLGLLQIRKEKKYGKQEGKENENLIKILEELLRSQKRYSKETGNEGSGDKEFADILEVAIGFAKLLEFRTTSNYSSIFKKQKISVLPIEDAQRKYESIERQKYVLISFKELVRSFFRKNIEPSDVLKNPDVVPCILQGSLEIKAKGENYRIPRTSSKIPINDLSTWENELCVFSPERGFIFFNNKNTFEVGGEPVEYKEYWKCIVRGIEYTVALRASLQLLESRTTRLLNSVPEILKLFNDKESLAEEKLKDLAEDLASVLRILPALRSIAIPTNAFRSGHSVKKFSYLYNKCFRFDETIKNTQKNIDELTDFLTFFEQQQLQISFNKEASREGKEDRKLNVIALLFTITSIIYVFPSFTKDFSELKFVKNRSNEYKSLYMLKRFFYKQFGE